jgi:predicted signal transduction protein with EAL and GGDEF domain
VVCTGLSLYQAPPAQGAEYNDPTLGVALFITTICLGVTLGLLMMSTERLRNRYAKLALTDELTELPNRRSFLEPGDRDEVADPTQSLFRRSFSKTYSPSDLRRLLNEAGEVPRTTRRLRPSPHQEEIALEQ